MMSEKARLFDDQLSYDLIMQYEQPKSMKMQGRKVSNYIDKVWCEKSIDIVLKANRAKFGQNEELKQYLLSTGGKILVETNPYDDIWGIGMSKNSKGLNDPFNWQGKNQLGFILTQVRYEIKNKG